MQTIESIYTGGKAVLTSNEQWLITSLGEDIDVTEFETGKRIHRLKGVRITYSLACIEPIVLQLNHPTSSLGYRGGDDVCSQARWEAFGERK